jgi:hypothetical protein
VPLSPGIEMNLPAIRIRLAGRGKIVVKLVKLKTQGGELDGLSCAKTK